jgi:hypothetical protein
MSGLVLYASLFEPDVARLDLRHLPRSHRGGTCFLNVQRVLDVPAAVAMAGAKSKVRIYGESADGWDYPQAVARSLGWDEKQIQLRALPPAK